MNTKERNSSIELLRIITMIMIMFHHFSIHGGFKFAPSTFDLPRVWYNLIVMGGKIGVNVYVLISGYYLIQSKEKFANPSKLLRLWGQVFFYSIILYIVTTIINGEQIAIKGLIWSAFPITFEAWWFASTYFVLFLIHPFLNVFLKAMTKTQFQAFLVLILSIWCIIPTVLRWSYQSNNLIWFISVYSIAAYIRIYGLNPKFTKKTYLVTNIVLLVLTYGVSVMTSYLGKTWSYFAGQERFFYGQNQVPIVLISVTLFMLFQNIMIPTNKIINKVASATFGVYLIHDNGDMRTLLWQDMFHNSSYQDTWILIPYSILVVIIVYCFSTAIDIVRQATVEKIYLKTVNNIVNKNSHRIRNLIHKAGGFLVDNSKE